MAVATVGPIGIAVIRLCRVRCALHVLLFDCVAPTDRLRAVLSWRSRLNSIEGGKLQVGLAGGCEVGHRISVMFWGAALRVEVVVNDFVATTIAPAGRVGVHFSTPG